jgi:hypothetical protein
MTFIFVPLPFPGGAERLTRRATCPNRSVSPSSESEGVGPAADAGKEMAGGIRPEIIGLYVGNASFIYVSLGKMLCFN